MGYQCNYPGCAHKATRYETFPLLPYTERAEVCEEIHEVKVFCSNHYAEQECPGHVASENNPKVCGRCGIHIDSLRPE